MNILHTADWHLGKKLANQDRQKEQALFLDWLLQEIEEKEIDILLISGDIFDVINPPNFAQKMYYEFIVNVHKSRCKHVIITGGNHDSVSTLNAPQKILQYFNIHVIGGATEDLTEEVIPIKNEKGEVQCVICAVPFLRDSDLRTAKIAETTEERREQIKSGIIGHYEEVYQLAKVHNKPIIAMGHLAVGGSTTENQSDSVREIHIGGLDAFPVKEFPAFDYIALGHIHRPQRLADSDFIRYSGSPIHLSFSEIKDEKQVCFFKIQEDKVIYQENIPVPYFRKLIRFSGTFEEVCDKIEAYKPVSKLTEWAEVSITEEEADVSLISQFEDFKDTIKHLVILKYKIEITKKEKSFDEEDLALSLQDLTPMDVFERKISNHTEEKQEELKETFSLLIHQFNQQEQE